MCSVGTASLMSAASASASKYKQLAADLRARASDPAQDGCAQILALAAHFKAFANGLEAGVPLDLRKAQIQASDICDQSYDSRVRGNELHQAGFPEFCDAVRDFKYVADRMTPSSPASFSNGA